MGAHCQVVEADGSLRKNRFGRPTIRTLLMPKHQTTPIHDWTTLGMRGTGSKSVRAKDVFVPEHRALSMYLARGGSQFPGASVNANPSTISTASGGTSSRRQALIMRQAPMSRSGWPGSRQITDGAQSNTMTRLAYPI